MSINATWHKAHRMPKSATLDQRIAWHEGHLRHCDCRPASEAQLLLKQLLAERKKRGG